jgi:hypothetical protein
MCRDDLLRALPCADVRRVIAAKAIEKVTAQYVEVAVMHALPHCVSCCPPVGFCSVLMCGMWSLQKQWQSQDLSSGRGAHTPFAKYTQVVHDFSNNTLFFFGPVSCCQTARHGGTLSLGKVV